MLFFTLVSSLMYPALESVVISPRARGMFLEFMSTVVPVPPSWTQPCCRLEGLWMTRILYNCLVKFHEEFVRLTLSPPTSWSCDTLTSNFPYCTVFSPKPVTECTNLVHSTLLILGQVDEKYLQEIASTNNQSLPT